MISENYSLVCLLGSLKQTLVPKTCLYIFLNSEAQIGFTSLFPRLHISRETFLISSVIIMLLRYEVMLRRVLLNTPHTCIYIYLYTVIILV